MRVLKVCRLALGLSSFVKVDGFTAIGTDGPPNISRSRIFRFNLFLVTSSAQCAFHSASFLNHSSLVRQRHNSAEIRSSSP